MTFTEGTISNDLLEYALAELNNINNICLILFFFCLFLAFPCFSLVCSQGTFGLRCSQRCQCGDGVMCDPVTGSCICPMGKMGLMCDEGKMAIFNPFSRVSALSWKSLKITCCDCMTLKVFKKKYLLHIIERTSS